MESIDFITESSIHDPGLGHWYTSTSSE